MFVFTDMFTGLIDAQGKVIECVGKRVWIHLPYRGVQLGESVSIDGVCLTVAAKKGAVAGFDIGQETRRVTTLKRLSPGDAVNLERALRVGDRLGGHWVSGHVEVTGRITGIQKKRATTWVTVELPQGLMRYVVPKGSIAIDGISLTVAGIRGRRIRLMIIPHTLESTTLKWKRMGDAVNVEPDLLAKYATKIFRQYS